MVEGRLVGGVLVGLNIKNERVAEKARRLAAQRQKTQTAVVEEGLDLLAAQDSRRLSQDRVDIILQRLRAIAACDGPLVESSLYDGNRFFLWETTSCTPTSR